MSLYPGSEFAKNVGSYRPLSASGQPIQPRRESKRKCVWKDWRTRAVRRK